MIFEQSGAIFSSGAEVLVNPVNCVGVMGAGLAKQFKIRFPEMFDEYVQACRLGVLKYPGCVLHQTGSEPRYIISLSTKDHWRDESKIEDVVVALGSLREICELYQVESVAIPALGCGLGGLEWSDVRAAIFKEFANAPFSVIVYGPR